MATVSGEIRVAILEDDARLRRAFLEAVTTASDCLPVAACGTAAEAAETIPVATPDVVIIDINLPDSEGVEHVAMLADALPAAQILVVTVYQDPETTFQALAAGAHGYLVKPVMPDRLLSAIREVRAGGVPMTRTIARKVIEVFRRQEAAEPVDGESSTTVTAAAGSGPQATLAPRERQVLDLLCEGCYYKEIAKRLGISISTDGTYVQRIYDKLHCTNRWEVVAKARPRPPGP